MVQELISELAESLAADPKMQENGSCRIDADGEIDGKRYSIIILFRRIDEDLHSNEGAAKADDGGDAQPEVA